MLRFALGLISLLFLGVNAAAVDANAPGGMKLFLLIGQSNMAGRGVVEARDRVPHPRVFVLGREGRWEPAIDPLHWDKPEIAGVGLASTFARTIAEAHPDAVIGLIPAAFGGTSLDQWAPGGQLYRDAVARAKEASKRGTLAGILWHQGEADSAPNKVATYAQRFEKLIRQLRMDLDATDVPVIVGELGYFRLKDASKAINPVIMELPRRVPRCAAVSAQDLTHTGDDLHFDSASLRELGRRYAQAWTDLNSSAKK